MDRKLIGLQALMMMILFSFALVAGQDLNVPAVMPYYFNITCIRQCGDQCPVIPPPGKNIGNHPPPIYFNGYIKCKMSCIRQNCINKSPPASPPPSPSPTPPEPQSPPPTPTEEAPIYPPLHSYDSAPCSQPCRVECGVYSGFPAHPSLPLPLPVDPSSFSRTIRCMNDCKIKNCINKSPTPPQPQSPPPTPTEEAPISPPRDRYDSSPCSQACRDQCRVHGPQPSLPFPLPANLTSFLRSIRCTHSCITKNCINKPVCTTMNCHYVRDDVHPKCFHKCIHSEATNAYQDMKSYEEAENKAGAIVWSCRDKCRKE
ncbi:hypothetical protein Tsubulata_014424 [Turnera subulata]|uniref:Uncharacterized protein n=1 Tax=Turnera subulata TaxID=218843 RepID=A0A9Q0FJJ7_9ROSI|nr:hypothetical protein Tsubulata_014424 [Turnera subulata]